MRYLLLLILLVSIISCRSSKKAIENTPNTPENKVVETGPISVSKTEIPEEATIEKEKEKTVTFNHDSWTSLLQKHVSDQGNVNYKSFKTDRKALLAYITSLGENIPTSAWNTNEKLAYWINAYNAMTVDLILCHYPIESIKDIKRPWHQRYWKLEKKWYNLDEIEHEILRKMNEPRIHFAIVCASFSCPKLQNEAFEASKLEAQLENATKSFINDPKRNYLTPTKIELSRIFAWFDKDFLDNGTGSIIQYINRYSNIKVSPKTTKRFMNYNWDLND